jgi:two-component system response regulator WspF
MMRIAIAQHQAPILDALRRHVEQEPGLSLMWTALTGEDAVRQCQAMRPDLLLVDLSLPDLKGAEVTRRVMAAAPCPILITCHSSEVVASNAPYEALAAGALDAVAIPLSAGVPGMTQLRRKLGQLCRILPGTADEPFAPTVRQRLSLLAIGASTGGPAVIAGLLHALKAPLCVPCVIIQHINPEFAPGMAHWLQTETGHRVSLAVGGEAPQPGVVYMSGGPGHLALSMEGRLVYRREPADYPYQPSIDEFFLSACVWPQAGLALLLTGMGRDGARGLGALREQGWTTMAQAPSSCAVHGMPQAAIEAGAAQHVLDPQQLGIRLREIFENAVPT